MAAERQHRTVKGKNYFLVTVCCRHLTPVVELRSINSLSNTNYESLLFDGRGDGSWTLPFFSKASQGTPSLSRGRRCLYGQLPNLCLPCTDPSSWGRQRASSTRCEPSKQSHRHLRMDNFRTEQSDSQQLSHAGVLAENDRVQLSVEIARGHSLDQKRHEAEIFTSGGGDRG